jgi:hypothetical protein
MGRGTYAAISVHLNAAAQIIRLRFLHDPSFTISRPFDRLAVESVLYQIFLVTTGCWGGDPVHIDYHFDCKFWLDCEKLLTRSTIFPGQTTSCNSPVLGVPLALLKLVLTLKQLYQCSMPPECATVSHLQREVAYWEAAIILGQDRTSIDRSICDDATFLNILIASLLVKQLADADPPLHAKTPEPVPSTCWQIREMMEILRRRRGDEHWERCFVANWPIYTTGFFVASEDDIILVREDMKRRWALSNFAKVTRFSEDLEKTWAHRQSKSDENEKQYQ